MMEAWVQYYESTEDSLNNYARVSHLSVYTWSLTFVLESLILSITKVHSEAFLNSHAILTGLSPDHMLRNTKYFLSRAGYITDL